MGNVLHVIFRYFIDTQASVVRIERVLLHKGDVNNVCLQLSHIVVYCDTDIVYCVPYRAVCITIHRCTDVSFRP